MLVKEFCEQLGVSEAWLASPEGTLEVIDDTIQLPSDRLVVGGDVKLHRCDQALPPVVHIGGKLTVEYINEFVFPEGTVVDGEVILTNVASVTIPSGCRIRSLNVRRAKRLYLPDNWAVPGDLFLVKCGITELPKNLHVGGMSFLIQMNMSEIRADFKVKTLRVIETPILSLPDNWTVEGDLNVRDCPIEKLPRQLTVGGELCISGTKIVEIPEDCKVGSLNASNTGLRTLPKGFHAEGVVNLSYCNEVVLPDDLCLSSLWLERCTIKSFPMNLTVKDTLSVSYSNVCRVPEDCKVGNFQAYNATLAGLPENWEVPGDITMPYAQLAELPKGLHVGGTLNIGYTGIEEIPADCVVKRLLAAHSQLRHLPEGWQVDGDVELDSCPIRSLPKVLSVGATLDISRTRIQVIHKGCTVGSLKATASSLRRLLEHWLVTGDLDVRDCQKIELLPCGLTVKGVLCIAGSQVKEIPADCRVGQLFADGSALERLPDNWSVEKCLQLDNCKRLTKLPQGLTVGWELSIAGTSIKQIPADCRFRHLDACGSRLADLSSFASIPGTLNIDHCPIKCLPDNFSVGGHLYAIKSALKELPKGLNVGGDLRIDYTKVTAWPEDMMVAGHQSFVGTTIESEA